MRAEFSKDSVGVRVATVADLSLILELERASPTAAHWTEEQYRVALENRATGDVGASRLVLLASLTEQSDGSNPLGFLVAVHIQQEWELENIVVSRLAQKRGIGSRLLAEFIERASVAGGEAIFLEVRESNLEARHLYRKCGFEETGRRGHYYSNPGEDAVLYRLRLSGKHSQNETKRA